MKLRTRLLAYFTVLSIIPLVLMAFATTRLSFTAFERKTTIKAEHTINRLLESANVTACMVEDVLGIHLPGVNGGHYKSNYSTYKNIDHVSSIRSRETLETDSPIWFGTNVGSYVSDTLPGYHNSISLLIVDNAIDRRSGSVHGDCHQNLTREGRPICDAEGLKPAVREWIELDLKDRNPFHLTRGVS